MFYKELKRLQKLARLLGSEISVVPPKQNGQRYTRVKDHWRISKSGLIILYPANKVV